MKTNEFIEILAQDAAAVPRIDVGRRIAAALLWGGLATLAIIGLWLHVQSILLVARHEWFWIKIGYAGLLTILGTSALRRLAVPGTPMSNAPVLAAVLIAIIFASGITEVVTAPASTRLQLWLGQSWRVCSPLIFLLSLPIYASLIVALRTLAPTRLTASGATAGFTAGALAATLFGLHCPERSVAFLSTWYTLGISGATVFGALTGRTLLRW